MPNLNCQDPTDSQEALVEELRASLAEMRRFPVPHVMRSLSQQLAELVMDTDMSEGVFHLTEAHGVSLRVVLETSWKLNPDAAKDGRRALLSYIGFKGYDNVEGMMERLRALPSEWTVVQLSRAPDAGGSRARHATYAPPLAAAWISLMPTGRAASRAKPSARRLPCPLGLAERLRHALAVHTNEGAARGVSLFKRQIEVVLADMERWLGRWRFLLLGRLADRSLAASVAQRVKKIVCRLADSNQELALRLAETSGAIEPEELAAVLADLGIVAADWPDLCAEMPELSTAHRQTVVLIVDQTLDMFPWEGLAVLKEQPVTRIESLHVLHMLYAAHADSMRGGAKMVARDARGQCSLMSMGLGLSELPKMRACLKRFLASRLPAWAVVDDDEDPKMFREGLHKDIFLYAGHGSGAQIVKLEEIQETRVNAVVLLMGCRSGEFTHYGGNAHYWGPPHAYHIACSPCVVGNLWNVGDEPTNRLTLALLHCWLPLSGASASLATHADARFVAPAWHRSRQPELARALLVARENADDLVVGLAAVCRGIPVCVAREQS